MTNLVQVEGHIPAMSEQAIANVEKLESVSRQLEQVEIPTHHVIHGGIYSRTILLPAGVVLTGALIKIPTTLIVSGDCSVYLGDNSVRVTGYNVFSASAGRKQAFVAHSDTWMTMLFKTDATTVEDAEHQFTDDAERLLSRMQPGANHVVITGE